MRSLRMWFTYLVEYTIWEKNKECILGSSHIGRCCDESTWIHFVHDVHTFCTWCGYILHMFGAFSFSSTSENKVNLEYLHYWRIYNRRLNIVEGLVLSYLYNCLCKVLTGIRTNATGYNVLLQAQLIDICLY